MGLFSNAKKQGIPGRDSVGGMGSAMARPAPPRPTLVQGGPAYFTPEGYRPPMQPQQAFMPTDTMGDPIGDMFRRQLPPVRIPLPRVPPQRDPRDDQIFVPPPIDDPRMEPMPEPPADIGWTADPRDYMPRDPKEGFVGLEDRGYGPGITVNPDFMEEMMRGGFKKAPPPIDPRDNFMSIGGLGGNDGIDDGRGLTRYTGVGGNDGEVISVGVPGTDMFKQFPTPGQAPTIIDKIPRPKPGIIKQVNSVTKTPLRKNIIPPMPPKRNDFMSIEQLPNPRIDGIGGFLGKKLGRMGRR